MAEAYKPRYMRLLTTQSQTMEQLLKLLEQNEKLKDQCAKYKEESDSLLSSLQDAGDRIEELSANSIKLLEKQQTKKEKKDKETENKLAE
jgi:hypothetical protein